MELQHKTIFKEQMKVYKKVLFLFLILSFNIKAIDLSTILEQTLNEKTLALAGSGFLSIYCISLCLCRVFDNPKKTEFKYNMKTYLRSLKVNIEEIPGCNQELIGQIENLRRNIKTGSRSKIMGLYEILSNTMQKEIRSNPVIQLINKEIIREFALL